MPPLDATTARSLVTVLFGALLVGALALGGGDTVTAAVGLGVLLLVGAATGAAVAASTHAGAPVRPTRARLRRQWGRAPQPLLDPGLPGRPQPRAPGRTATEVVAV